MGEGEGVLRVQGGWREGQGGRALVRRATCGQRSLVVCAVGVATALRTRQGGRLRVAGLNERWRGLRGELLSCKERRQRQVRVTGPC